MSRKFSQIKPIKNTRTMINHLIAGMKTKYRRWQKANGIDSNIPSCDCAFPPSYSITPSAK